MAYSKKQAGKRFIKKLKERQKIFENNGNMQAAEKLKKKIVTQVKRYES